MKRSKIHLLHLSYISAFVTGTILFSIFWKILFGSASSAVIAAGMFGVATVVTVYWIFNEIRSNH